MLVFCQATLYLLGLVSADVPTIEPVYELSAGSRNASVHFLGEERIVVVNGAVRVYVDNGELQSRLVLHEWMNAGSMSVGRDLVLVAHYGNLDMRGPLQVVTLGITGEEPQVIGRRTFDIGPVNLDRNSNLAFVTTAGLTAVYELPGWAQIATWAREISAVSLSRDGKKGVVKSGDQWLHVDAATGDVSMVRADPNRELHRAVYDPTWPRAFFSSERTVYVWDLRTGELKERVANVWAPALGLSPDGRWLVVGQHSGRIDIHDSVFGNKIANLRSYGGGSSYPVADIAFSPSGRRLAVACWDMVVRTYDLGSIPRAPINRHWASLVASGLARNIQINPIDG